MFYSIEHGAGEEMKKEARTKNGFTVCRRCDECGVRISDITIDANDRCTLKCRICGKEYNFKVRIAKPIYQEEFPGYCPT
jgi:transcription elongation factor Elf1